MSDDIWILGIYMTKFGKYPDRDTVDLASEAALAALADGGVTMKDMGVLAAGCLMGGGGIAQQIQKQIGQTGIPAFNVSNACATGATALRTAIMAVKAGEADYGLAVGVEKLSGAGLLAGGSRKASLSLARRLLAAAPHIINDPSAEPDDFRPPCPCCGGRMIVIEVFERWRQPRGPPDARTPDRENAP